MSAQAATTIERAVKAPALLQGLTEEKAARRLREFGPNDPTPHRHGELLSALLSLFVNPLVVILLIASILSAVLGQRADAVIIFVIAMSSVAINFFQTYRSGKVIQRLREHVSLTATVLRDGAWRDIRLNEVGTSCASRLETWFPPMDVFLSPGIFLCRRLPSRGSRYRSKRKPSPQPAEKEVRWQRTWFSSELQS